MNNWRKLGLAGLIAGALALSGQQSFAACINTGDNTVDNPAHCLFATGGAADSCRVAVSVDMDGAGTPPVEPKKIVCMDGAACDADNSVNGSCSFRVGACVNVPNAGCDTATMSNGLVTAPKQKDVDSAIKKPSAAFNRNNLQRALDGLLPTAGEACTSAAVPIKVDLKFKDGVCAEDDSIKCKGDGQCATYCVPGARKAGKTSIALSVDDIADDYSAKFKLACVPDTDGFTNGARAFQISNSSDLIGGPLAVGKVGDYMIRNGNVRAVVRAPGRAHSFMLLNGGQIVDADLNRLAGDPDRDSWQGIQPLVHISSSQATDTVAVDNDGDVVDPETDSGIAMLSSSGPDDLFDTIKGDILVYGANSALSVPSGAIDTNLPVDLKTDFILNPYSNAIQFATTVSNNSGSALSYYMGDFINPSGQLEPFGPGQGYGETQLRNGSVASNPHGLDLEYLAFQGQLDGAGVTYAVVFPPVTTTNSRTYNTGAFSSSGVYAWITKGNLLLSLFAAPNAPGKQNGNFAIPAMGDATLRRWFVVGKTVADVTEARGNIFGTPTGALQGVVTVTPGGAPVAGAHVTLITDDVNNQSNCTADGGDCVGIYSSTLTDESGFYRFLVPPGDYSVLVRKAGSPYEGSAPDPTEHPVLVEEKKTTLQNLAIPDTGTIVVNVKDQAGNAIAGKVSVVGVPQAYNALNDEYYGLVNLKSTGRYFGFNFEEKGDVFGLADARFADATGTTGSFTLEPGTYHVVVSHGYEYDVYDEIITVTGGATTTVDATVNQVVDTTGFVSIDTHVHMIHSPDSTVSNKRRIVSMLAEGVDFFANTDHDFTHDLADEVAALGAGSLIKTAPSAETTTSHYGHFNMWPLTVDTSKVDGGAPDWSFHLGDVNGSGYPADGAYDNTPGEIYALGHAYAGTQVVQINHFNSGTLGAYNMLGIDTGLASPTSSNSVYRCVGGTNINMPCKVKICVGGANDGNTCTLVGDCPGGACPTPSGGTCPSSTCALTGNSLASYLRLNPAATNLFDNGFTALEVWIEAGRSQTATFRSDNMGDWFNLLNNGRYKAGVADSDTHSSISVQAGGPRTFVASSTDAPGSINVEEIATNVNGLRAIGSNGPFLRVELNNGSATVASQALGDPLTIPYTGTDSVDIHVESPLWAEYDTIDLYINANPDCVSDWNFFGVINPSKCTVTPTDTLVKGVDFTVTTSAGVSGFGQRQVTDVNYPLAGLSADTWVVVVVRGTDGVSHPLFPMQPQDIAEAGNDTLAGLTDSGSALPWNLNESGTLALAYTNPLFFDDGDSLCHGGTACP